MDWRGVRVLNGVIIGDGAIIGAGGNYIKGCTTLCDSCRKSTDNKKV